MSIFKKFFKGKATESDTEDPKTGKKNDYVVAILTGDVDKVRSLADTGEVNIKLQKGWTPLMFAASEGNIAIVDALLSRGADVDMQSDSGETALMLAVRQEHMETVKKLLIEAEANVNLKNNGGKTALTIALENNQRDILHFIESQVSQK